MNNMNSESESNGRLDRLFKQLVLGVELENLMKELVPANNPWWTGEDMPAAAQQLAPMPMDLAKSVGFKTRMFSIPETLSDWKRRAAELFKIGDGAIGSGRMAFASTVSTHANPRACEASNFQTWWQGDLCLKLSCDDTPPFTVRLHVDGDLDAEVVRLCWVDEDKLVGDPDAPPEMTAFSVAQIDAKTYMVEMPVGVFAARIRAIVAAQQQAEDGGIDPCQLLPFVVIE